MRTAVLTTIALLVLAAPAVRAQDWDKFEFSATELRDGLWWLRGAGGNVAMSTGDDGVLLVDADYEQMGDKLVGFVRARTGAAAACVVSTHWHFDHVGGNEALAGAGAVIVAHENVRWRMAVEQRIELLEHVQPPSPEKALPAITFTDSLTLYWNGEQIVVFHPGGAHTDGDAVVHFRKANVIHTGDIFFNCGYPFIDTSCGGGIDGMIAAVETILGLCDAETLIVPGHGPLARRGDLETYLKMLADFRAAAAPLKAAGMSLEEVQAAGATAGLDEKWGQVFFPPDLFTAMVYLTLDRSRP
ncbi:MBL fold metallo-hydrolase [bacterium]|nr:MBL fold metallo-hydrolase [bacterium]MBU1675398.1 MBL fold metallo-hydrolase [bacterium]